MLDYKNFIKTQLNKGLTPQEIEGNVSAVLEQLDKEEAELRRGGEFSPAPSTRYSTLAQIEVSLEDYHTKDGRALFTWEEAQKISRRSLEGWRLPTRKEMVLLCEEFAARNDNSNYNSDLLEENLKLVKRGYETDGERFGIGKTARYWTSGSYGEDSAFCLTYSQYYVNPLGTEDCNNSTCSIRLVRDL